MFRARVLARTLVYVFLVTSTFFAGFFRITYLYPTFVRKLYYAYCTNCKNVRKYERRYRGLLHCTLHVLVQYLNIAEAVRRSVSTQPEFSFTTELIGASETSGETLHIQGKVF